MDEKSAGDKIQAIFDAIANTKVWDDPFIVDFGPDHVDMNWTDYKRSGFLVATESRRIVANGWGFDRPDGQELKVGLRVVGTGGVARDVGVAPVFHTDNYKMQIAVNDYIRPGDQKLVFQCGNGRSDARELPIIWADPPSRNSHTVTDHVPKLVLRPQTLLLFWTPTNKGNLFIVDPDKSTANFANPDVRSPNRYIADCCSGPFVPTEYVNARNLPAVPPSPADRAKACIRDKQVLVNPVTRGLAVVHQHWPQMMNNEMWFIVDAQHKETVITDVSRQVDNTP